MHDDTKTDTMATDPIELRQAFGTFATGVTLVTTLDREGRPRGITANSFTSVSLDPALLLVCIDKYAESCSVFCQATAKAGEGLTAILGSAVGEDGRDSQALPSPEFASHARTLCDERDALLIIDEAKSGFRLCSDCSWSLVGVRPELLGCRRCERRTSIVSRWK